MGHTAVSFKLLLSCYSFIYSFTRALIPLCGGGQFPCYWTKRAVNIDRCSKPHITLKCKVIFIYYLIIAILVFLCTLGWHVQDKWHNDISTDIIIVIIIIIIMIIIIIANIAFV